MAPGPCPVCLCTRFRPGPPGPPARLLGLLGRRPNRGALTPEMLSPHPLEPAPKSEGSPFRWAEALPTEGGPKVAPPGREAAESFCREERGHPREQKGRRAGGQEGRRGGREGGRRRMGQGASGPGEGLLRGLSLKGPLVGFSGFCRWFWRARRWWLPGKLPAGKGGGWGADLPAPGATSCQRRVCLHW